MIKTIFNKLFLNNVGSRQLTQRKNALRLSFCLVLLSLFSSLVSVQVQAKEVYVSDVFFVPLHSGPGKNYRIIHQGVKTGTKLELIDENSINDFYRVKTSKGLAGYIPKQFVKFEKPATDQLEKAISENKSLLEANANLSSKLKALTTRQAEASTKLEKQKHETEQLLVEYNNIKKISGAKVDINERYKALLVKYEELKNELYTQKLMNQELMDNNQYKWYLYGCLSIFGGILIGLIAPNLRFKKKHNHWI